MAKNRLVFEHDEKKSILIALVVSAVVVLALVLTFVAIKAFRGGTTYISDVDNYTQTSSTEMETELEGGDAVIGEIVVSNQEELNNALNDSSIVSISFVSEEEQSIVIPKGEYNTIDFSVNGPQTEITNYGIFSSITIYQIAANTWTESASGNSFVIDSAACHLIVPSGIEVNTIETLQNNSSLALEISGTVSLLAIEAIDAIVSAGVEGELSQVILYNRANLSLSGWTEHVIPIEIAYGADDVCIDTSAVADITSFANSVVTFEVGAEDSSATAASSNASMTVKNMSESSILFKLPDGAENEVASQSELSYNPSDAGTGGSSGGQTSSESDSSDDGADISSSNTSSNSGSSSGSSGSSGGSSSGSSGGTTVVNGYTKAQVDEMINTAVSKATQGKVSATEVQAKIDAAKKEKEQEISGLQGMIQKLQESLAALNKKQNEEYVSKTEAQKQINDAVAEAVAQVKEETKKEIEEMEETAKKPVVIRFINLNNLYAGKIGEGIKAFDDIKGELKDVILGQTSDGTTIEISGVTWNDVGLTRKVGSTSETMLYKTASEDPDNAWVGTYRFIARIPVSDEYTIPSGLVPEVGVVVQGDASSLTAVQFDNPALAKYVEVNAYEADASVEGYDEYYNVACKQNVEGIEQKNSIYAYLAFTYYDDEYQILSGKTEIVDGRYICPGESWTFARRKAPLGAANYVATLYLSEGMDASSSKSVAVVDLTAANTKLSITKAEGATSNVTELTIQVLYLKEESAGVLKAYGLDQITTGRLAYYDSGAGVQSVTIPTLNKILDGYYGPDDYNVALVRPTELSNLENSIISKSGGYAK